MLRVITSLIYYKSFSKELNDSLADKVENTSGLPTRNTLNKKGKVVGQEFDWATYAIEQRKKCIRC